MEESAFLPQQQQETEKQQQIKMKKPLMIGLALVLLITVILITVLATSARSGETSAAVRMERVSAVERPWMDGDYKCGKINWAIVRVDGNSQVESITVSLFV